MEKFTDQIALLIGLVFCLNGYSFYGEKCYSIENNTTGTLQCPDGKSIVIKQIGFANKNCSSDAFLNPRHLSLLTNIKCTNMSTCRLPFQHHLYNFLNIGFQCKECVFTGENNFLKCRFNHKIKIDNILVLNNTCPAYDIFKVKNIQRNDIKSNISEDCNGNQTCEIIKDYPNNTSIYFHCEAIEESAVNDTDRRLNESSTGNQNHTLINLKSNQTYSPDHESSILNHTPEQPSGIRNHTPEQTSGIRNHTPEQSDGYRNHTPEQSGGIRNHTPEQSGGNRNQTPEQTSGIHNHTPKQSGGKLNHTQEQASGNRNHTSDHGARNQTHTTVTTTKKNPCSICSLNEQCQTFQIETETYITCSHESRINISMAWVDKSDCNDIITIAGNVVNLTRDVSSRCSGHSNCSLSFHPTAAVVGFLNVIYNCNDDHQSPNNINKRSNEKPIGGAIAGGVSGILIAFLLIGVFLIRRCRNKNAHESNANEINKTRSNLMYDPSEIQVDQEINNQRTYSENLPQKSSVYSMDTNYDHLQSKESNGNNYTNGKDTNYIHKRDSSTYDHIQSKDGMRNQQTKTLDTDVYSHLKGGAAVSDAIYDHTLRNGIRDNFEGDYDVSRGIMTDDDYDVSGNFNQSQVKNSDSLYN